MWLSFLFCREYFFNTAPEHLAMLHKTMWVLAVLPASGMGKTASEEAQECHSSWVSNCDLNSVMTLVNGLQAATLDKAFPCESLSLHCSLSAAIHSSQMCPGWQGDQKIGQENECLLRSSCDGVIKVWPLGRHSRLLRWDKSRRHHVNREWMGIPWWEYFTFSYVQAPAKS